MDFPYTVFELTIGLIVIYLAFACYLFYLIKKIFPDFWNKSYPYGVMMTKVSKVPFISACLVTLKGYLQMAKVLLTSRFSENKKIRIIKNISRVLLVLSISALLYLVFIVSTTN